MLQGVREVEAGLTFCLSLPLDYPGGTALNQRRYPPVLAPTEDMDGNAGTFYNVRMSEMEDFGDPKYVDVWADDMVTLSLQYSTQWDSLAHVGAEFDADGDGVEEAVYYNGYRAGTDLVGPAADAAGDGGAHRCFAHHLGLEHMAYHGVQGRGVLVDLAHHLGDDWRAVDRETLEGIMAADGVVVEPGDMLLLHTGFATEVLEYERGRTRRRSSRSAATSTPATSHCSSGSPTRRSRRWWPTTTRSRACSAATATRAGTRSCRSTTCASSSWVSRWARCGTCTSWPPGCASTAAAASCSPPRRCGCPGSWAHPLTPVATV